MQAQRIKEYKVAVEEVRALPWLDREKRELRQGDRPFDNVRYFYC